MAKPTMSDQDKALYPSVSSVSAGFKGVCPRCGQGRLFSGMLEPAKSCMNCRLDYSFIDSGDGPAVFVILILGFVILGLALAVEGAFSVPIWAHMLIWLPVTIVSCLWALRAGKGIMIALQYQTSAREGSLDKDSSE